ncbi:hypothetical protein CXB51_010176 [Gossypium anomalum]|uniref:Reverse transcriptase Ty1/copia-type domain-containing protein n=1 Tax=Gossypium anomalum TaxID=47600 RepID=A0A8J6D1Z3_9ROSI|nr:hypothetical protein CXB51_010176 [Gossypium anomalum]
MATDAVSGNDNGNHPSIHISSIGRGCGFLRKVQQFPKHDTSLIDSDGNLVANPDFLVHEQQDKLLAFWLLSMICDDILVHLTDARLTLMSGVQLFREYELIRIVTSSMPISLDLLTDMLVDCEARQQDLVLSMPLQAIAFDHFEAEVEECILLTISLNVNCVVALVIQFRNATIGLMSPLKKNFVYHPGLQVNTASANSSFSTGSLNIKFTKDNQVFIEFHPFHYFVKDIKTGNILLVGPIHNGLYQFDLLDTQSCNATLASSATVYITSLELPGSNVSLFDLWHKRFGHPYNKTVMKGPAPIASEGHFYYISFVNAYSRLSCCHTSEQNGLVERKHRHLVDTRLTLLTQANMHFWAHVFISAAYFVNRLPTLVLVGKSPFEVLHKTVPSYKHLRVFGFLFTRDINALMTTEGCLYLSIWCSMKVTFLLPVLLSLLVIIYTHSLFYSINSLQFRLWCLLRVTISSTQQVPGCVSGLAPSHPALLLLKSTSFRVQPDANTSPGVTSFSNVSTSASVHLPSSIIPLILFGQNLPVSSHVNAHPMITGSKNGIFKPRVFSTELCEAKFATIDEALASKEWVLVAQQEYEALLRNDTWDLVPLPANRRAVGCKWVFKLKRCSDGTIARYKGCLVVKGYLQEAGFGWQLRQVDINNAFLNGDLSEEIYMLQPPGFEQNHRDKPIFSLAKLDGSLFIKKTDNMILYVLVYVNDIIITGNHQASIDQFVTNLDTQFSLKDLGPLSYFLGIEANGSPTPMVTSSILSQYTSCAIENTSKYCSIVGALQYVVITRPDVTFAVNKFTLVATLDIVGYSDMNWGTNVDDQRSTAKAEYRGLAHVVTKVIWLESLLFELHVSPSRKTTVWCDNSRAVVVSANLVMHSKFKHVELDLYFVREKVTTGKLSVGHVPA